MKKQGSTTEFAEQRAIDMAEAMRQAWKQSQSAGASLEVRALASMAVKMPASRFWVSEERAYQVVSRMLRGKSEIDGMRAAKARMFVEICHRVQAMQRSLPGVPLLHLVTEVVYQPAPEFYMEASHAIYLVNKHRRERRKRRHE